MVFSSYEIAAARALQASVSRYNDIRKTNAVPFKKARLEDPTIWEAVEAVAVKKQRVLVVQRTGWGKSLVYFLATKLLREEGAGPTLLISPLLSLMRNQMEMAAKIGIRAYTINSANKEEWSAVEEALTKDECDLMLISPVSNQSERLAWIAENLHYFNEKVGSFIV